MGQLRSFRKSNVKEISKDMANASIDDESFEHGLDKNRASLVMN
jgi:hypothetical protein